MSSTAPMISAIPADSFHLSPIRKNKKGGFTYYFQKSSADSNPWSIQVGDVNDETTHVVIAFNPNESPFDDGGNPGTRIACQVNQSSQETKDFFDIFDRTIVTKICADIQSNPYKLSVDDFLEQKWTATVRQDPNPDGGFYPMRLKGKFETASDALYPAATLLEYDPEKHVTWDIHHTELRAKDRGIMVMWPYNIWTFAGKMGVSWVYTTFMRFTQASAGGLSINFGANIPAPTRRMHDPNTPQGKEEEDKSNQPEPCPAGAQAPPPSPVAPEEKDVFEDDDAASVTIDPVTLEVVSRKRGASPEDGGASPTKKRKTRNN